MANPQSNVAVLIDGDNVSYRIVGGLMAEVAKYGTISVRRIYGDWTTPNLRGWKAVLLDHSITPIQQFAYTSGKNATDGAMIIDAMDLLYTGRFSSFCIVSSDSDFTRLASRIREQGVTVYGFGERKTNSAFINACNQFTYFDVLADLEDVEVPDAPEIPTGPRSQIRISPRAPIAPPEEPGDQKLSTIPRPQPSLGIRSPLGPTRPRKRTIDQTALVGLATAVNSVASDSDNWVNLADVGQFLSRISPDLLPRNYGYDRLREFVEAAGVVDMKKRDMGSKPPVILVRLKESLEQ